jgi:iron complex outermembrane receptor protein
VAQIEASLSQITAVRVEATEAGLQVILETAAGELATPATQTLGNALIADIPNAAIAEEFSQAEPIEGIALVSVTSLPGDRVRVAITGTDAPPVAEVTSEAQGLAFAVTLGEAGTAAEDDAIQVVVTGEQDEGYNPRDTSVGTRTDTPLRDIPQSIQVVPRQVLEDQQPDTLRETLRNVPGVVQGSTSQRVPLDTVLIRGFSTFGNTLRNGLPDFTSRVLSFDTAIIDQIEVLRGPASVLYGQGSPGGTISYTTKQPLSQPFYEVEGSVGNFGFYRGSVDLSGPLNTDETVLYRLNLAAQTSESFIDFFNAQRYVAAPTLTWLISDRTRLTLEAEYLEQDTQTFDVGLPAVGTVLPNPNGEIPRDRYLGEPDFDRYDLRVFRVGYNLEHRFSEDWQLRNAFRYSDFRQDRDFVFTEALQDDNRTMTRRTNPQDFTDQFYSLDTYVVGEFATGSIQHQLVTGFALTRLDDFSLNFGDPAASIDLFDPVYGLAPGAVGVTPAFQQRNRRDALGIYIQDQISLLENLKLLIGGRFDITGLTVRDLPTSTTDFQQYEVFTPRIGIVYQPIPPISLYASYAESFNPVAGTTFDGDPFQPERGTQYEIGVKADVNDRLSATLALFDLTRSNVTTADPDNIGFSIQTGEQRSRGVEFNIAGEILPGWNVIAGYAYTDAEITEDNTFEEGNRLNNVPENAFNIWTTYEIQQGDFQGLGIGLGLFSVGERQGDLANTFEVPSYFRTDAAIFYQRDRFRAAINLRNLFDVDYFESALSRNRVFLGDPLTIQGTVSWEF